MNDKWKCEKLSESPKLRGSPKLPRLNLSLVSSKGLNTFDWRNFHGVKEAAISTENIREELWLKEEVEEKDQLDQNTNFPC